MGPRPPGTMYRQATHPAQVQRAQEMAHAAAQQATMRVNGALLLCSLLKVFCAGTELR